MLGAYGSAKLVDKIQEKRTGQPSTAARDGVKQAAGPAAVTVGIGAAGGALAALTPEILAEAMWNPVVSQTLLDMWLAKKGPALPTPSTPAGWFVFAIENRNALSEAVKKILGIAESDHVRLPHDSSRCTPQTQPRDEQGLFASCPHSD